MYFKSTKMSRFTLVQTIEPPMQRPSLTSIYNFGTQSMLKTIIHGVFEMQKYSFVNFFG